MNGATLVVVDAPKPFWQKSLNEAFPTLVSAFTALNWASTFFGLSALSRLIYQSFDEWFEAIARPLAETIRPLFGPFSYYIEPSTVKLAIIWVGLIGFAISGLASQKLRKDFESLTLKTMSITMICAVFVGWVVLLKTYDASVTAVFKFVMMIIRGIEPIADLRMPLLLTTVVPILISCLIWFFLRSKFNNMWAYIISLITIPMSFVVSGLFPPFIEFSKYDAKIFVAPLFYSMMTLIYLSLPVFLLALNPKRLRQISLFIIVFSIFAFAGIVFDPIIAKL